MTQFYFGERWDAPAFEDAKEIATPIGEPCGYCEVKIKADDRGTTMSFVYSEKHAAVRSVHLGCYLRAVLGGPAHLMGKCSCFAPATAALSGDDHDSELSLYEEGEEVLRILENKLSPWMHGARA